MKVLNILKHTVVVKIFEMEIPSFTHSGKVRQIYGVVVTIPTHFFPVTEYACGV